MKTFIICKLELHINFTEMTFLSFKQIYVESSLDDTTKINQASIDVHQVTAIQSTIHFWT